ncbi:hypothetical protein SEUCBS139899_007739 [Sporothrix eucalyptigena]|uniref:Zn(2)-C6 fungal-type domain-containing protein n=1 Tax=Sporothrix eucalyptigena TaxID=1812306 RepID=A0ABP0B2Y4_9PEZI
MSRPSTEMTSAAAPAASADHLRPMRKFFACDECKRRKIRCSGGDRCGNCDRDAKACRYSSPSQRLVALQRRLLESENQRRRMEQAWAVYLPGVDLTSALQDLRVKANHSTPTTITTTADDTTTTDATTAVAVEDDPPTEHVDADDLDFDESSDPDRAIDGMAFLTAGPHKSGYTGPQSGIAALKFLQSLPPYLSVTFNPENTSTSPLVGDNVPDVTMHSAAARARYIDDYFALYHPAYPMLHEGTFRARVAGALAKPRDGSWPLLYYAVLAIGAFVSTEGADGDADLSFFREARRHLGMAVLEKGSLGYVQALTLLANYLQKRNKPNTGFVLIGTAFSMAVAIGLHREFEMPRTSPFTMELRRRTWWTLFVFLSGAQLALGRPAVAHSDFEVSVRLPANLDDAELAVDMEELSPATKGPTVASCLIEQVRLARIANQAQAELAAHRRPHAATVARLEERIRQWRSNCPAFFDDTAELDPRFECPKRVLVWRSLNLRIVLNRSFLFEAIASGAQLVVDNDNPVHSCLMAADECASSICSFLRSRHVVFRGFAWYTTAWLMTASFVQATCLIYMPQHALAAGWRTSLQEAAECLRALGASVDIALRARGILQNVLMSTDATTGAMETKEPEEVSETLTETTESTDTQTLVSMGFEGLQGLHSGLHSGLHNGFQGGFQDSFAWLQGQGEDHHQHHPEGEFLGPGAGGFVYGNGFDLM